MGTLGIVVKGDDRHLQGKLLMKRTMQIRISAADTLLFMITTELPFPKVAQKHCVETCTRDQWTTRLPRPSGPATRTAPS